MKRVHKEHFSLYYTHRNLIVKLNYRLFVIFATLGVETGRAIAEHPDIRKVGFTGSTATGHKIMKASSESNLKKVSLELGGKSPLIIFDDCDLEKSVRMVR